MLKSRGKVYEVVTEVLPRGGGAEEELLESGGGDEVEAVLLGGGLDTAVLPDGEGEGGGEAVEVDTTLRPVLLSKHGHLPSSVVSRFSRL